MMLCLIFAVLIGFVVPGDALKASDCRCRLKSNEKIGYGKMSPESEYPWHTSLGYLMDYAYNVTDPTERRQLREQVPANLAINAHVCGGIILNERWILTAAHCLVRENIGAGFGNSLREIMVNDRIPIKQSLIHPNYDAKHKKFDVALLELESDVTFTDDRQPACLPTRDYEPYTRDRVLKAIGFGTVEPKIMFQDLLSPGHDEELTVAGKCSNRLRETSLIRVPQHRDDCAKGHTLCLNSYNGLSHINVGDSGSPIHLTLNGRTMPYALTVCFRINLNTIHNAFFPSAGRTEAISIYHVLDFIHTYVSPNDLCSF